MYVYIHMYIFIYTGKMNNYEKLRHFIEAQLVISKYIAYIIMCIIYIRILIVIHFLFNIIVWIKFLYKKLELVFLNL